jgi:hypothetical protein
VLTFVEVSLLVIVALREAIVLLILLVSPPCHHVVQLHDSSRMVASEVMVGVLQEEAVLEIADDILVGNVSQVRDADSKAIGK